MALGTSRICFLGNREVNDTGCPKLPIVKLAPRFLLRSPKRKRSGIGIGERNLHPSSTPASSSVACFKKDAEHSRGKGRKHAAGLKNADNVFDVRACLLTGTFRR